jgi:hypothetical protein
VDRVKHVMQRKAEFEKTSKIPFCLQFFYFFSLKNANCNQRSTFLVYSLSTLNVCFIENILFNQKLAIEVSVAIEWGSGGKICKTCDAKKSSFLNLINTNY